LADSAPASGGAEGIVSPAAAGETAAKKSLLALLARFGAAGLVNTGIGLSVIAALDLGLHVDPHLANAVGYAGGLASGYALNRIFVFRSRSDMGVTGLRYLVAVGIAFGLNQAVLAMAGPLFGPQPMGRLAAQVMAMASYTGLTFVLCRAWVFRASTL
jgi:putative flippase GtrA